MKKLLLIAGLIFTVTLANAQVFEKGDVALNVGVGLGDAYYSTHLSPIPAFNASLEIGIVDIPNVGVIGVGGFGAFRTSFYNHSGYKDVYTNAIVAGRGVFHQNFFDAGNFDLYAGVNVGVGFYKYSWEGYTYLNYTDSYSYLVDDAFIGARWMKNDKFGFFAELGYGISYLKAGISLKF